MMIYDRYIIYNTDTSNHPDLDLPILYLNKAFTGKFASCLGLYCFYFLGVKIRQT